MDVDDFVASDDDYYSDAGGSEEYEDDADDDGGVSNTESYTVLSPADIGRIQEERIAGVSRALSLSRAESTVLLLRHGWTESKVHDEWFADEARVRDAAGLIAGGAGRPSLPGACGICFEDHAGAATRAAACGHGFCVGCWRGYVSASIGGGPGCLLLRCPEPSCRAAVGRDMVYDLAAAEEKERYDRFLVRSYVEATRTARWCPAPGCELAVDLAGGGAGEVACGCGYGFCWGCGEEAHRPVDCGTVRRWVLKNSAEAENTLWLLANSKPCPRCARPIEKNSGCMHMTCGEPCRFEFCWLCLGPWSRHGAGTGGFYSCNEYRKAKEEEGAFREKESRRDSARRSALRYSHYYERWAANHSSGQRAREELGRTGKLERLMGAQGSSNVGFVAEAWRQIVECRRVLKWTYAYGYYIPAGEHGGRRRRLFEYMQGEAEAGLERLHRCAETELQPFLDGGAATGPGGFEAFHQRLAGLTSVTRTYFRNLVQALENGLKDVERKAAGRIGGGGGDDDESAYWSCASCTCANPWTVKACEACGRRLLRRSERH